MLTLNGPTTTSMKWRTSEEIYLLWDNEYLKMNDINTKSFEEQGYEPCMQTLIILSVENIFAYSCKV